MNPQNALLKIKKCLALATSSNPHEAAAAMRQAQKLMERFGISEDDIDIAEVTESAIKSRNVEAVNWEVILSHMVAKAFSCQVYGKVTKSYNDNLRLRRERKYDSVGVGASSEIAAYAFDVLSRQCAKDRRSHMAQQSKSCKTETKTARGDVYALGWCDGVREKLMAFAENTQHQSLVAQYMQNQHGQIQSSKSKNRIKGENITRKDWSHGVHAGSHVQLGHGISASGIAPSLRLE